MSDVIYVAMRKFCYNDCDRVIYPTFDESRQRITMGITKPVLYVHDHYVVSLSSNSSPNTTFLHE